jgi:hypothetical protein
MVWFPQHGPGLTLLWIGTCHLFDLSPHRGQGLDGTDLLKMVPGDMGNAQASSNFREASSPASDVSAILKF